MLINSVFDLCVRITFSNNNKHRYPSWFNRKITHGVRQKQKLLKLYKKSINDPTKNSLVNSDQNLKNNIFTS